MAIKLIIKSLEDSAKDTERVFDTALLTVGRSHSCMLSLEHPLISRRHFILEFLQDEWFITDEGSSHGTTLDNKPLIKGQAVLIKSGQKIGLANNVIIFDFDGQKPKVEHTRVVAKKLIKEIFTTKNTLTESSPVLASTSDSQVFYFSNDKSEFLLGSAREVDFLLTHPAIASEHASFVRDINGICVVPILGHEIYIEGIIVKEITLLTHGQKIRFAQSEFIFKENSDEEIDKKEVVINQDNSIPEILIDSHGSVSLPAKKSYNFNIFYILDNLYFLIFFILLGSMAFGVLKFF